MQARRRAFLDKSIQGSAGRPDGVLELTEQARGFNQIKRWIERDGLELERELFKVIPAVWPAGCKLGQSFKLAAAHTLAWLTQGNIVLNWRQDRRPISRLVPAFYEASLDCYFLRFEPRAEDECELALVVHVETLRDARDSLSEYFEQRKTGVDGADQLLRAGLLTWGKLLPDNSRVSWEEYRADMPLIPNFATLAKRLAPNGQR